MCVDLLTTMAALEVGIRREIGNRQGIMIQPMRYGMQTQNKVSGRNVDGYPTMIVYLCVFDVVALSM